MTSDKTIRTILTVLSTILVLSLLILIAATLDQPGIGQEPNISLTATDPLSGFLPGVFIVGRFSYMTKRERAKANGCITELFKPIVYLLFWPLFLIIWLLKGKK